MTTITIKPHHFIDIIKLYGAGIETFVPDEKMGHDFYKIANIIISEPSTLLILTTKEDDICLPCNKFNHKCIDTITHIDEFTSKDLYNIYLDTTIIDLFNLKNTSYSALTLCQLLLQSHDLILDVWKYESKEAKETRLQLFKKGAAKYISKHTL